MLILTLLIACGDDDAGRSLNHAEDCGTWTTVGQPILLAQCTSCHASGLDADHRFDAPLGVDLDTLEGASAQADAIIEQVGSGAMPPGGGLSASDADQLIAWLECGAPGDGAALPSASAPTGLVAASETRERFVEDDAFPGGLVLRTTLHGGELDGQERWSEERYWVAGDQGWLAGRTLYDADGGEALVEDWDPPLLVYDGAETRWTVDTLASRSCPGQVETRAETWEITVGLPLDADPRQTDPDAETVRATLGEPPDGPGTVELGWSMTADLSFSRRWRLSQDEGGATTLEDHLQLTVAFPFDGLPAFPADLDVEWMGRVLVTEGGAP